MRLNERWLWLGDTAHPAAVDIDIWCAYPGCYFVTRRGTMSGPYNDRTILRAVRVACTPTIDGCELGPAQLGFAELDDRRRARRAPRWRPVSPNELPSSFTRYDPSELEPVHGCCTSDTTRPAIHWMGRGPGDAWALAGRLTRTWNAHPPGSCVLANSEALAGEFTIVDDPQRVV